MTMGNVDMASQRESQTALETLRLLRDDVRSRYKAELIGVFGSCARGDITLDSDVDVLVDFQTGATLFDLSGLGSFLESHLHRKVDVVSQRALREEIKSSVFQDLIRL